MSTPIDRLTFPPFPSPPNDITIIPFSQFKERGIQIFSEKDNDVERDGLGIPTVELRVKHDTDACKTETKRSSRAKKAAAATVPSAGRKEWWEAWMDAEDLRGAIGSYNPNTSPIDRLYEAAADFRKGRTWPPAYTGIAAMWDQFRLFVGLLSNTPIWTRTDKPPQDDSDDEDDEDSIASDADPSHTEILTNTRPHHPKKYPARRRARPPYALYDATPVPVNSDDQVQDLLNAENARREERIVTFLNDPAGQLRVFLSSYMRKQGLIWADRNLVNYPRLVAFFVRFLVRARVFPEPGYERAFGMAVEVAELAQKELVLTSRIAKAVPDGLSLACTACWGGRADGYKRLGGVDVVEVGMDVDGGGDPSLTAVEKFEAELKAQNVQVINTSDDILPPPIEVVDIDTDNTWANTAWPDSDTTPALNNNNNNNNNDTAGTNPWSATSWPDDTNAPAPADPDPDSPDPDSNPWAPTTTQWDPPAIHALPALGLGPTALPLTHTPGIVEWAVRRVKSWTPPPPPGTLPKSPVVSIPKSGGGGEAEGQGEVEERYGEAEAVEVELERRFGKVVFGPWIGWDKAQDEMPHLAVPRVLVSSRGAVVSPDASVGDSPLAPAPAPVPGGDSPAGDGVKPHDPFRDDITVLVEPGVLCHMSVGMGLGATWVQIAREGKGKAGKKKGKGGKKEKERYWYIDELLMVLPSYHT